VLLLLLPAVGQDSYPSGSWQNHSQWCRGDENDSADCTTPPRAIYSPDPEYPVKERNTGHEGSVTLRLVVDADGVAHDITVSGSLSPAFDAAALEAVRKWKFSPAMRNGKPVLAHLAVQVQFHTTDQR
jgi:TonB family protein